MIAVGALFVANIVTAGLDAPLWLDENFSATIAAQPDLAGLLDWCLNELSGPLYYSILWTWEKIAGDGDIALRIPSLVFSVAAPAVLLWRGHDDRQIRWPWAICVALWAPGFDLATQARPYTLMVFLGCVQAVCFVRLMRPPTLRRTALWGAASSLAILTHYHALVITTIQGLAYILAWRRTALQTWPAIATLLPPALWMSWHLPLVLGYAVSGQTWYQPLTLGGAAMVPLFLCGSVMMAALLVLLLAIGIRVRLAAGMASSTLSSLSPEIVTVITGLVSVSIVVALGFVQPSFSIRYLLPYVGALSLVTPLALRTAKTILPIAPVLTVAVLGGSAIQALAQHLKTGDADFRYAFNFERPADWIMANGRARHLVFLWDNPTALLGKPEKLADVGGFFFRRASRPVEVLIPRYALNADPYPSVLALANRHAETAVIWAYGRGVPNTSSLRYPPGVLREGEGWTCRDFGTGSITVLACLPRTFPSGRMPLTLTTR